MAQVVAHDGKRLLLFTHAATPGPVRPMVEYGRILDLSTLRVWPEVYLGTLAAHGQWTVLKTPMPADVLLARARPQPLR